MDSILLPKIQTENDSNMEGFYFYNDDFIRNINTDPVLFRGDFIIYYYYYSILYYSY